MLFCPGYADNGNKKNNAHYNMNKRRVPATKQYPGYIEKKGQAPGIRSIADHFIAKWPEY